MTGRMAKAEGAVPRIDEGRTKNWMPISQHGHCVQFRRHGERFAGSAGDGGDDLHPAVRIIGDVDLTEMKKEGLCALIRKPYNLAELSREVARALVGRNSDS